MNESLPNRVLEAYLANIRQNTVSRKLGDLYVISLPFISASGHFVEVFVREVGQFISVTDKRNALSELWLSGINVHRGEQKRALVEILKQYGLQMENDEIVALGKLSEIGEVFSKIVQAMIRIDDIRLLHKTTFVKEEPIVEKLRRELSGIRPQPLAGPKAVLPGKIEPKHKVDFLCENKHKFALKTIDPKKGLQEKVEAWAFKFGDMRSEDKNVLPICVYDEDNENWNKDLFKVAESNTALVASIQKGEQIRNLLAK